MSGPELKALNYSKFVRVSGDPLTVVRGWWALGAAASEAIFYARIWGDEYSENM